MAKKKYLDETQPRVNFLPQSAFPLEKTPYNSTNYKSYQGEITSDNRHLRRRVSDELVNRWNTNRDLITGREHSPITGLLKTGSKAAIGTALLRGLGASFSGALLGVGSGIASQKGADYISRKLTGKNFSDAIGLNPAIGDLLIPSFSGGSVYKGIKSAQALARRKFTRLNNKLDISRYNELGKSVKQSVDDKAYLEYKDKSSAFQQRGYNLMKQIESRSPLIRPDRMQRNSFKNAYTTAAVKQAKKYNAPIGYDVWSLIKQDKTPNLNAAEALRVLETFPEYAIFIRETGLPILNKNTVDAFLKRQGRSVRGTFVENSVGDETVYAKGVFDKTTKAKSYLTVANDSRPSFGGDRLETRGGLYTSNSTYIANRFKNPVGDKQGSGFVGYLQDKIKDDENASVYDRLLARHNAVFNRDAVYDLTRLFPTRIYRNIKDAARKGTQMVESEYTTGRGSTLPATERAYYPKRGVGPSRPVSLIGIKETKNPIDEHGRWGFGDFVRRKPDDKLFIPTTINRTTDFIKLARGFLTPTRVMSEEDARTVAKIDKLIREEDNKLYRTYTATKNKASKNTIRRLDKVAELIDKGTERRNRYIFTHPAINYLLYNDFKPQWIK